MTQFVRTSDGKHYIKSGYYRNRERTVGDNWDYDSNILLGGIQYTTPEILQQVRLNMDYTWEDRNYRNDNIFFGRHRSDIERTISASISRDIGDHITLSADYLRRDNSSNLELFDYKKNIFSLGITYRY